MEISSDERDFIFIESELSSSIISPLQCKAPKEIHAILTEILICFLPGRAKDLPAPHYVRRRFLLRPVGVKKLIYIYIYVSKETL